MEYWDNDQGSYKKSSSDVYLFTKEIIKKSSPGQGVIAIQRKIM